MSSPLRIEVIPPEAAEDDAVSWPWNEESTEDGRFLTLPRDTDTPPPRDAYARRESVDSLASSSLAGLSPSPSLLLSPAMLGGSFGFASPAASRRSSNASAYSCFSTSRRSSGCPPPLGDVLPLVSEASDWGGGASTPLRQNSTDGDALASWLRNSPSPIPARLTPEMSVGASRARSDVGEVVRRRLPPSRRTSNASLLLASHHLSGAGSGGSWWRESMSGQHSGSSREGSSSNLSRLRSRSLGQSCPNLAVLASAPQVASQQPLPYHPATQLHSHHPPPATAAVRLRKEFRIQRRHSQRMNRRSFHAGASPVLPPRCRSPSSLAGGSHAPRLSHQMHQYHGSGSGSFTGVPFRPSSSAAMRSGVLAVPDTRRWSLASLPSSSGYGTPGSSAFSSTYSSTERLHPALEETIAAARPNRFGSGDSNPSSEDLRHKLSTSSQAADLKDASNNSSQTLIRPRSRSLSSLSWLNLSSSQLEGSPTKFLFESPNEAMLKNNVYKERFPKAKTEMEERLCGFLSAQGDALSSTASTQNLAAASGSVSAGVAFSDGATRFLLHQILETAADCLAKSREDRITSAYFLQLNDNLNDLVTEAKEKAPTSLPFLSGLIRELLLIVARPARLLECLEFNPEDFYHWLEMAEGHVRAQLADGTSIPHFPQYIIEKLGLSQADASLDSSLGSDTLDVSGPLPAHRLSWTESMLSSTDSGLPTQFGAVAAEAEEQKTAATPSCHTLFSSRPPVEEDFETVKLISNGAYGAVWLVRHAETRERFALKKLSKRNMMLRNTVEQVFAERDILTFASNPFVVSFYGSFETKSHLCMVMEYVEGGDCASLLKAVGVLPVETAKPYLAEAVLAIEYLHSYGIVHRDIKPDNLLITATGHVKLTDFGLSKIGLMNRTTLYAEGALLDPYSETHQFQDHQLSGTPEYIAPECILRQGYGKPVDWWALGIITFELLMGSVPFVGASPEELFMNIVQDDVQWGDEDEEEEIVEEEAKDLVNSLLVKHPLDRLGTLAGADEVKCHPFFADLDYRTILKQKAEFIPQLDSEEDTSYFDTRADRYNHAELESEGEETPSTSTSSTYWAGFSSPSPRHSFVGELPGPPPPPMRAQSALEDRRKGSGTSVDESLATDSAYSVSEGSGGGRSRASSDVQSAARVRLLSSASTTGENSSVESTSSRPPLLSVPPVEGSVDVELTPKANSSRRRTQTAPLPRFAISCEADGNEVTKELSPVEEKAAKTATKSAGRVSPTQRTRASSLRKAHVGGHAIVSKSSSLHLVIPSSPPPGGVALPSPGASSNSSREDSPSRSAGILQLKPPIVLRKGAKGFGFTIRSVRVYLGEASEYYTIQHIISAVDENSPAFEAGLRSDELITHVHGEAVQNLTHPQLMQRLFSFGDSLSLRTTPLDQTSIRTGAARKTAGKLARKKGYKHKLQRRVMENKKRKASLLRRLSGKRTSGEALAAKLPPTLAGIATPPLLPRSVSSQDAPLTSTPPTPPAPPLLAHQRRSDCGLNSSPSSSGSSCSSPAGSSPHSPAFWQSHRPSSLHGLRSKLAATILKSPGRRKPSATIPLSPLARVETEQPPLERKASPTRSPSPLAAVVPPSPVAAATPPKAALLKKTITKPRSSEGAGPSELLRLALHRPPAAAKEQPKKEGAPHAGKS